MNTARFFVIITSIGLLFFNNSSSASVEKLETPPPLTVLWWNVAGGTEDLAEITRRELHLNLALLGAESRYDILAFGEFDPGHYPISVFIELLKSYPYYQFHPYSDHVSTGMAVFSKFPFATKELLTLDWMPIQFDQNKRQSIRERYVRSVGEKHVQYMNRIYWRLEVQTPNGPLQLIPTHTAHAWQDIMHDYSNPTGLLAKVDVASELWFGTQNPLVWQLDEILMCLQRDTVNLESDALVLFGDMNFPAAVGPKKTLAEVRIREKLRPLSSPDKPTFPDKNMKLDRFYGTPKVDVTSQEVLDLRGSDHLPVTLSFRILH